MCSAAQLLTELNSLGEAVADGRELGETIVDDLRLSTSCSVERKHSR